MSTKQTNRVAPKKYTSGANKKFFLSDLISRGISEYHTENSDKNSNNNSSVLAEAAGPQEGRDQAAEPDGRGDQRWLAGGLSGEGE